MGIDLKESSMKYVYVAGPLSAGETSTNIRKAMNAAATLLDHGLRPFLPHLTYYFDIVHPRPYNEWINYDLDWVLKCDAVLRLDGKSPGADEEVGHAEEHGIPVYYGVEGMRELIRQRNDT